MNDLKNLIAERKNKSKKKAISIIFVQTYGDKNDKSSIKSGKKAYRLYAENLDFSSVKRYTNLSKSQMIEKLDMLQCQVDDFERKKFEMVNYLSDSTKIAGIKWSEVKLTLKEAKHLKQVHFAFQMSGSGS